MAVFIYWRRVRRVVDWSWQFFVVGVEPSHANSMSWRHAFTVTYAQYPWSHRLSELAPLALLRMGDFKRWLDDFKRRTDDFKLSKQRPMFLFETRVIFDLVQRIIRLRRSRRWAWSVRFSQKQQTITDRDHVSVSYHHRVMRRFSFRRRILLKHTDLAPQWCEVHNPLHGKLHAVQGQPLFGVRPVLKSPIGALKIGHLAI